MSLRDEIAQEIYTGVTFGTGKAKEEIKGPEELADAILYLPSGLVAVRECGTCKAKGLMSHYMQNCPACHGTGRIERNLSVQEALEWATTVIDSYPDNSLPTYNGEQVMLKDK